VQGIILPGSLKKKYITHSTLKLVLQTFLKKCFIGIKNNMYFYITEHLIVNLPLKYMMGLPKRALDQCTKSAAPLPGTPETLVAGKTHKS
jgi:hypothetical protein